MGFEDLEARLRFALEHISQHPDTGAKTRIAENVKARFKAQSQQGRWLKGRHWFARTLSLSAMSALLLGTTGIMEVPFLGNQVVGQIESRGGVVEIIRGDESLLVAGSEALRVGDWVRVGHRGQAHITTDYFASDIEEGSWLKLERPNTVFLDKGRMLSTHWQTAQIKTNRGVVKSGDGGEVAVEVLETGETHVLPSRQRVAIFDLNNGKLLAQAGEKVVLRSDTVLNQSAEGPTDLELSNAQIEAILGKLVITRTKALTGIENMLQGERDRAHLEIMSAEQSFRSIVQILDNSRDMTISRRLNLDSITVGAVLPALVVKTDRADLLTEAYALEQLFTVLAQNKNSVAFAPVDTQVAAYNRYVLLQHMASMGNPTQAAALNTLADNYVVSLLRKVQQSPIKIEQLAYLNQQVDALPLNEDSQKFLMALKGHLSPDLASALGEKIDYLF